MTILARRNVLKGMLRGAAVTVALPFLDLFLDGNGEALAATGAPIPTRFGTWFWGCGVNQARWFPTMVGKDYQMNEEMKALAPFRDKITIFSGLNCDLGGRPNLVHWSAVAATLTGVVPNKGGQAGGTVEAPTLDCLVSDHLGKGSRFRSLEIGCTGDPKSSYSMRPGATVNPSEVDPVSLYRRLFGPEFRDPNAAQFKPDPALMLERSVLSSIKDERDDLMRVVGAADRQRIDQYFTSVRQMEEQLALMLEKPARAEACTIPKEPEAIKIGPTIEDVMKTHDVLGELLVMALACNQTRVFSVAFSSAGSNLRKPGEPMNMHDLTHEEPLDEKLGYQPKCTYFMERSMESLASMLKMLNSVKEGNGTLLDNMLLLGTSESNFAKIHSIDNLPIMVAGSAGGKWKSGQHLAGKGDPSSRVGLTIQQALGMPVSTWGEGSMEATRSFGEVLA